MRPIEGCRTAVNGNLILVAGYPKSGSTWVRIVFEALRRGHREISINALDGGHYGARRRMLFDEHASVNSADLLPEEIDDFLPEVFRALARAPGGPHVVKAHDAAFRTRAGGWLYPPEAVRIVIYLTRHPFDVAVSYAHHLDLSVGEAVAHMGRDETVAASRVRLRMPLHERLDSWSGNINSWLGTAAYKLFPVRYEDLFADPMMAFAQLAKAAGFAANEAAIAQACEATRFDRLQSEERRAGFFERPRTSPAFFRAGRPRSWNGVLDETLRAKLVDDHHAVMAHLGYDAEGNASGQPQWRAFV